jgi:hypothetical protein
METRRGDVQSNLLGEFGRVDRTGVLANQPQRSLPLLVARPPLGRIGATLLIGLPAHLHTFPRFGWPILADNIHQY